MVWLAVLGIAAGIAALGVVVGRAIRVGQAPTPEEYLARRVRGYEETAGEFARRRTVTRAFTPNEGGDDAA
jgi:hypothetical protein